MERTFGWKVSLGGGQFSAQVLPPLRAPAQGKLMKEVHLDLDRRSVVEADQSHGGGQFALKLLDADHIDLLNLSTPKRGVGVFFRVVVEVIGDDVPRGFRGGDAPAATDEE